MKLGIIGAGGIAKIMADTVRRMENVERTAIAARDLKRAEAFAEAFGFRKAYGSYEELLTDRRGIIYGTEGFLEILNINNPELIRVWSNDRHPGPKILKEIPVPEQITGYEYEVEACARAIAAGATECPEMPHAETLEIMGQMDTLRKQFGIVYPGE